MFFFPLFLIGGDDVVIIIFFCFNRYEAHYGLPLGRKKTAKSVSATYKYGSVVFIGASLNNLDIRNCNWAT